MARTVRVLWRGTVLEVEIGEPLLELLRTLEGSRVHPSSYRPSIKTTAALEEQLLNAIDAISSSRKGLRPSVIAKAAGLPGADALGGAVRGWSRVLRERGFNLSDAFQRKRNATERWWEPGERIEDVKRDLLDHPSRQD